MKKGHSEECPFIWEVEDPSCPKANCRSDLDFSRLKIGIFGEKSMPLEDSDVAVLTVLLSPERLGPLTQLTGSARTAIELHQQTLDLGAALMAVTAVVEIALRNALCENLGRHFGNADWLLNPPAPFQWRDPERKKISNALDSARRAEYSKLSQAEKHLLDMKAFPNGLPPKLSHLRRAQLRRGQITVTAGKVIAELTLYFWKRLYGPDYEQTLWRTTLKTTFPFKKLKRADIANNLEHIYQSRNRLAHHEPVLHKRFSDTMMAIQFVIEHLQAAKPSDQTALAKLVADDISEVNKKAKALHSQLAAFRVVP